MKEYFVIVSSEDGEPYCEKLDEDALLAKLKPRENNEGKNGYYDRPTLAYLPSDIRNFEGIVIIEGRIVVPKAKQVVTEYELP